MEWQNEYDEQSVCDKCEIVMDWEDEDDKLCADCLQDQFGDE